MTAKEEAQILVNIFRKHASGLKVVNDEETEYSSSILLDNAKQCAIIHIDEIIIRLDGICFNHGLNDYNQLQDEYDWLRKIKQEIESL